MKLTESQVTALVEQIRTEIHALKLEATVRSALGEAYSASMLDRLELLERLSRAAGILN